MVSPLSLEELWQSALVNYGLERPSEDTEIHVFRVILQTSLDKKACTRSVTPAGPMSDPLQTLEQIIEEWWGLEGDPQRPHGVLEVSWGHRYWITAIALPKWINTYHCVGLLKNACGPMLSQCCAMWCDDNRLREELVECHIGSLVQVHIETFFSDLVRIDLQAALQRSIDTLHLPVKRLQDNQVFVPHGVTCFSGTTFVCISQFENWQAVLIAAGKRAYPGRNPDTMIFHRVDSAFEEVSSLHDPITKHFILADSEEQERTRTVVFAVSRHAMSSLALVIGPRCVYRWNHNVLAQAAVEQQLGCPMLRCISETTDEERWHVEHGTIDLLQSNLKMRFVAPGDWIRIKFDLKPLVRHACGELYLRSRQQAGEPLRMVYFRPMRALGETSLTSVFHDLHLQIVGSLLSRLGVMGDQDMATFDDADWSEGSRMDECDPGAPLAVQASSDRYPDYSHASFAYKLRVQILPNDEEHREGFDNGVDFRIGDPNVHFRSCWWWCTSPSAKPVVFIWSTPPLCLVFPGLHIVLLDSDCVPVTLFEVEDLWHGGLNLDQVDQSTQPKPKEQGVILVTEHNAEVNAGFAVLRGSNHAPPLLEEDWQSIPLGSGDSQDLAIRKYKQKLVSDYWKLVSTMVSHGRDGMTGT
eukprot:symbB.v1.2.040389.t1/scaffold7189.1/size25065/2